MELNIRRLTENDWDTLVIWWQHHFNAVPAKDFLPGEGLSGIIIEKQNTPICACFIYSTNSKVAFLEWTISNPEYKEADRSSIIDTLLLAAEQVIKDQGFKYIFGFTTKENLARRLEKLGHTITHSNSFELIKTI